jgi:hypothetical protein
VAVLGSLRGEEEMELGGVSEWSWRWKKGRMEGCLLLADAHGRHHGEEDTDGELDGAIALEEVEHGDALGADLLGIRLIQEAAEFLLDGLLGGVVDEGVQVL